MPSPDGGRPLSMVADTDRQATVLESALETFARFGYRKTSMQDVARAAHISRPGLYFLFTSKEVLFRAAVTQALERDIAAVERVLSDADRPLRERLLESFDRWTGRYLGRLGGDVAAVVQDNPDLLGTLVDSMPRRFEELITDAICMESGQDGARRIARTMISTSIGIKYQVEARDVYLDRMTDALDLLTPRHKVER